MCARMISLWFVFSLALSFVMSPAMVWAERVWDKDLKRYLTDQELMHADVFLTEEDALKLMFPQSERIRNEVLKLSPEKKLQIEERIGWKFPEEDFEVYIGETGAQIDGYALIQNTIGKHKPMTYMVGVDAQGRVSNVELLIFREARGSEVRTKRFNVQYEGKTVSDPVRLNKDIINISGATMSVRSMTAGIKRVLVLVDEFYLKPQGIGSDAVAAKKSEQGIFGAIFGN
ncbi:MAG: FMN-binding protein [Nitrospirota bacterium]